MSPKPRSRFALATALSDEDGNVFLAEHVPFAFRPLADTRVHTARDGDTLFTLAGTYFAPLTRPCGFWWVIADFQPDPIIDPTLALEIGRILYIPSVRTLLEVILSEDRREEFTP